MTWVASGVQRQSGMTKHTRYGDAIVGYGTYGNVRGYGPRRGTLAAAEMDLGADQAGCRRQGGYSDRQVVAIDSDGACWAVEPDGAIGDWVPGPGGAGGGAARYRPDMTKTSEPRLPTRLRNAYAWIETAEMETLQSAAVHGAEHVAEECVANATQHGQCDFSVGEMISALEFGIAKHRAALDAGAGRRVDGVKVGPGWDDRRLGRGADDAAALLREFAAQAERLARTARLLGWDRGELLTRIGQVIG